MRISKASFGPILDCYNPKRIDFLILFIEENISNQSSGVIGTIGFLSSSMLIHLVFYMRAYGFVDF